MPFSEEKLRFILGFKLKNLRLANSLSLKDVSKKAGLSISYLSEIEKGKKYPKAEKLLALAECYGIGYDELVTVEDQEGLRPLSASLDSGFFREFPFQLFGIRAEDLFSFLTSSPDKAGALIRTFMDIGQTYDISIEQFLFAALRAYQKMHNNYFEDLESSVRDFTVSNLWKGMAVNAQTLRRFLEKEWNYVIDEDLLVHHPELNMFRSVFIPSERPRLFVNKKLLPAQKAFVYAKEIGTHILGIKTRATTSSWIKVESFDQVLNNFRTSYFAGALLLDKESLVSGLERIFSEPTWNPQSMLDLMYQFDATPEMFFYRIGQLAYADLGLGNHFFMRIGVKNGERKFEVTKTLNHTSLSMPGGSRSGEHYCRKWAGVKLLNERCDQREVAHPDLPARSSPNIKAQRSLFNEGPERIFTFAMSRTMQLSPEDDSCVILGFQIDEAFKKVVKFWEDPEIEDERVGLTCERCHQSSKECFLRAAAPIEAQMESNVRVFEKALGELVAQYSSDD